MIERLPGFRDFFPEPVPGSDAWSADLRRYIFDKWTTTARSYGFREYDGPPLEPLELYTTKSGEEIVGQLYNFIDKGDRSVALRPEMTPTLARMIAGAERHYKKPIKWFAVPQLFRYERQQKGRLREHFQFNADLLGETDPGADAELIALLVDSLRAFGLTAQDFVVRLSSRHAWQAYFSRRCQDSARSYEFFQIVDKLEREKEEVSATRLSALGFSLDEIRQFVAASEPTSELAAILANLTSRGLADFVRVDYSVVRGLAYYTGPVFEAFDLRGDFRAIAGGGRYDNLIKLISNDRADLPALGFGMGDVVLRELLKARNLIPTLTAELDVFCLIEDEAFRPASLGLIQKLREAGLRVEYPLVPAKPDKQLKRALEGGAPRTVRVERSDDGHLAVRVRNLKSREEKQVPIEEILQLLMGVQ